jgi:hypothetical protein
MDKQPKEESLREILAGRFEYPEHMLDGTVNKINAFSPEWRRALDVFVNEGQIPGTEAEGYTVQKLIDTMEMNPIGAFLAMDGLMKKPEEMLKMINHVKRHGFYTPDTKVMNGRGPGKRRSVRAKL